MFTYSCSLFRVDCIENFGNRQIAGPICVSLLCNIATGTNFICIERIGLKIVIMIKLLFEICNFWNSSEWLWKRLPIFRLRVPITQCTEGLELGNTLLYENFTKYFIEINLIFIMRCHYMLSFSPHSFLVFEIEVVFCFRLIPTTTTHDNKQTRNLYIFETE